MTFQNNGAAIGVGVAIFIVVIIIIIVVAFGCNGGWFGRYGTNGGPQAYVALSQKKKADAAAVPYGPAEADRAPPQPQPEVVLAQTQQEPSCAAQGSGDDTVKASFNPDMYHSDLTVHDDEDKNVRKHFDPTTYFPSEKQIETISGDTEQPETEQMDANKITLKELKQRYTMQGWVDRFQFNSRNGATRTLGMSSSLLRPWYEDFVAAQKRACARRERQQASDCDDDSCVQFNESSYMYDACDQ